MVLLILIILWPLQFNPKTNPTESGIILLVSGQLTLLAETEAKLSKYSPVNKPVNLLKYRLNKTVP